MKSHLLLGLIREGEGVAARAFPFSDALKSHGGNWDWDTMSAWLANPKKFAPGTKMTFAGLSKPEDRANVMAFLNSKGSNLPLPAAPAAAEPTDDAAAKAGSGTGDGAQKAENEPVLNEQQAVKGGTKNVGGEGAAKLTGPDATVKQN